MKRIIFIPLTALLSLFCSSANAQGTFTTIEYLDVNNIKAAVSVHGDLWCDPDTYSPRCEFPKGSGNHVNSNSAIWMSAYDPMYKLHVSAQTAGLSDVDYWPGPLDVTGKVSFATSQLWARIWKVDASDIKTFKTNTVHTISNIPASILEWPAKGNPYAKGNGGVSLAITSDMAPYVDVNHDSIYDPTKGDYPDIKGDQALWWVFSDNGATHTGSGTGSFPLDVEIHTMAYAFNRNTLIDNVLYYEYTITNKSGQNYDNYRFGLWSDADLGFYEDDYIGFDSSHRMGYMYNKWPVDGNGGPGTYGNNPPASGVTFIDLPGDNNNIYEPIGNFAYYLNDNSATGNPFSDVEFNNYLRGHAARGAKHLINDFTPNVYFSSGYGLSGTPVKYVFPGDPSNSNEWSECSANNPPDDRRYIISSPDYSFKTGSSLKFVFALITTDTGAHHTCGDFDLSSLQTVADTAWNRHKALGINRTIAGDEKALNIYPNPAHDFLYIAEGSDNRNVQLQIYDASGNKIPVNVSRSNGSSTINIADIPHGVYHIFYQNEESIQTGNFIKE